MRHMGYSLVKTSKLSSTALVLIMDDSSCFKHAWASIHKQSTHAGARLTPPGVSLIMTLLKSLRLEVRHRSDMDGPTAIQQNISSIISSQGMLDLATAHAQILLHHPEMEAWVFAPPAESASSGGSSGSSNKCDKLYKSWAPGDLRFAQVWLRLQLVLVRSWVLFWVEASDQQCSPEAYLAATALLCAQASQFKKQFALGAGNRVMDMVMHACGFNKLEFRIQGRGILSSHACWEFFATRHLDGPPLPGCCNWACTNLDGFSEAALPTRLCSGCRRVRYCSEECQRTAWVIGEHRYVCDQAL